MIKSTTAQRAVWLSVAPGLAVLSSLLTLFMAGISEGSPGGSPSVWWLIVVGWGKSSLANAWSVWLLITGVFSLLSSLEGVPAIFRSSFQAGLKLFLLGLHFGGALTFVVPLGLFVRMMLNLEFD